MDNRTFVALVFCIVIVMTAFAGSIALINRLETATLSKLEPTSYTIRSGDTLWRIAKEYCPDYIDIGTYVDYLKSQNEMIDSTIYPGDIITVFYDPDTI